METPTAARTHSDVDSSPEFSDHKRKPNPGNMASTSMPGHDPHLTQTQEVNSVDPGVMIKKLAEQFDSLKTMQDVVNTLNRIQDFTGVCS